MRSLRRIPARAILTHFGLGELHESVLVDLDFQQLIRLSETAGPRLLWSLESSLSPWGIFFREGKTPVLRDHLSVTRQVKGFCFKLPKTKDSQPHIFEYGLLSFLQYRSTDWETSRLGLVDHTTLCRQWVSALNQLVIHRTWSAFHENYSRLIEPWVPQLQGTTTFDKLASLTNSVQWKTSPLNINELAEFIETYQNLRLIRAQGLAKELSQLADLYDAHPTRLKEPFAPQTRRRNVNHVPANLRSEARKMVKRVAHTWWGDGEIYQSRFAHDFPALVPYDWSVHLFSQVYQKYISQQPDHPQEIVEKCRYVLEESPRWMQDLSGGELGTLIATVPGATAQPKKQSRPGTYCPHTEQDLVSLVTFAEIVPWMELEYPDELLATRRSEWASNSSLPTRTVPPKE
jgi:hypothetical protein